MYQFIVQNMTCQGCGAAVTRAITGVDKQAIVKAFPAIRMVEVRSTLSTEQLFAMLDDAGYPAHLAPENS